ncbi:bifunctional glycosyltransferase/CDP-glycerol:glycerophosphate glycerophosphotransferase [Nocardioides pantholopis]|uniref:bifunctional glycosyltransferase/CDP-glycerol:glycerophosphate glycerophosphotransferase n=1 Tax=Nocardioides pantholopis TaxID=2483798 RepID=UPI000FD93AB4|nr:CDP-glycerol glycerophosphotransferase family protein [Nocardioides pantholopis]
MTRASRLRTALGRITGPDPDPPQDAAPAPALSVVVPVYNVAAYLPECLDSLLGQTLRDLEVVAVDDGSTDGSLAILEEYAARDPRLRVLAQNNTGQGIARNEAVALARGEFLTFCDADDVVPRAAYAHMLRTLRATGSDFCVGGAMRFSHQREVGTSWGRVVHDRDRLGVTIDEFPAAMQDIIACNRMFRTAFWRDRVPPFRGHIAYEDHVPMLAAYVRAERFDVLARVTYRWRIREDNTSTGQQKANLENFLDRVAVKEEARVLLLAEASPATYDAWVARTIDVDFQPFLDHALAGGDMYRNLLAAVCATMFGRASEAALAAVRFNAKVRAWLCAQHAWEALVETDEHFSVHGRLPPVRVVEGRVLADPPPDAPYRALVPERLWQLADHETELVAGLRDADWSGPGADRLRLVGHAVVRGLGSAGREVALEAWLREDATGATLPLDARAVHDPAVNAVVRQRNAEYDESGFTAVVDLDALVAASTAPGGTAAASWSLRLRVAQDGIVREGGLHETVDGSAATDLRARIVAGPDGTPLRVSPVLAEEGLVLVVSPVPAAARELDPPGTDLTGRLVLAGELAGTTPEVALQAGPDRRTTGRTGPDGRFAVPLPDTALPARSRLVVRGPDGDEVAVAAPPGELAGPDASGPIWASTPDASLELLADGRRLRVRDVTLADGEILLDLDPTALEPAELRTARLVSADLEVPVTRVEPGADWTRLAFPERVPRFGNPPTALPRAGFALVATTADGVDLEGEPAPDLRSSLPADRFDGTLRVHLRLRRSGALGLLVALPLDARAATPAGQTRLRRAYQAATGRSPDVPAGSVLLVSGRGSRVDGDPLAIDRELARSRPDLVRYWAVRDHGSPVPEGSLPVVVGSPAWYDVLRSAAYLCTDGDLDGYVVKRDFQRVLQTFSGHPGKAVGRTWWDALRWSEERIAVEVARRAELWDAVLAPDDAAADLVRAEFSYPGRVLALGGPRCDQLLSADRSAVRSEVLAGLGVDPATTVVLHAPTYRDAVSPRVPSAGLLPGADPVRLAADLGPGHTVLFRAHPLDRKAAAARTRGTPVVDVTDHPRVDRLLLAADAAVLDYSALRFDWALTGRPAVFLSPDREAYLRLRPQLLPYEETLAGPLVESTAQAAERLRDPSALERECAPLRTAVRQRFLGREDGHAAQRVVAEFFSG